MILIILYGFIPYCFPPIKIEHKTVSFFIFWGGCERGAWESSLFIINKQNVDKFKLELKHPENDLKAKTSEPGIQALEVIEVVDTPKIATTKSAT